MICVDRPSLTKINIKSFKSNCVSEDSDVWIPNFSHEQNKDEEIAEDVTPPEKSTDCCRGTAIETAMAVDQEAIQHDDDDGETVGRRNSNFSCILAISTTSHTIHKSHQLYCWELLEFPVLICPRNAKSVNFTIFTFHMKLSPGLSLFCSVLERWAFEHWHYVTICAAFAKPTYLKNASCASWASSVIFRGEVKCTLRSWNAFLFFVLIKTWLSMKLQKIFYAG